MLPESRSIEGVRLTSMERRLRQNFQLMIGHNINYTIVSLLDSVIDLLQSID